MGSGGGAQTSNARPTTPRLSITSGRGGNPSDQEGAPTTKNSAPDPMGESNFLDPTQPKAIADAAAKSQAARQKYISSETDYTTDQLSAAGFDVTDDKAIAQLRTDRQIFQANKLITDAKTKQDADVASATQKVLAGSALDQQKRNQLKAGGRQGTIATGSAASTSSATPRTTILGY